MKKILLLFACGAFLQISAQQVMIANFEDNGTDKMTENRIREEGGTPFTVVDNPLPNSTINSSSKVLKLTDVTSAGRLAIGLDGYWDGEFINFPNESDSITIYDQEASVAVYNTFRFKLYLEGETANTNTLKPYIEFFNWGANPQPARDLGIWTNELEGTTTWNEWNIFTIEYTPVERHRRMILVINNGKWDLDPDVTYYVDDIEFFDSYSYNSVEENNIDKLNYLLSGKQLTVSEIPAGSVFSVYDISGRNLHNVTVDNSMAEYTFNADGLYLVSLKNGKDSITQKILVK